MASMRQNIARALIKTRIGLTTRELSDDLQLKPQTIGMDLAKMAIEGTAIKGEYLEGEGQLWQITEKGVATYATKEDLEVKTPVVEVKTSLPKPKNKPLDEIKSVKMPVEVKNNVQESALAQNEKTVAEAVDSSLIVVESVLPQNEPEPVVEEITVAEIAERTEKPFNEMEISTFEVFKLTDNLASSFIKLMQSKQAKPVENIDYKVKTLHCLADILNSKHSATLREIAADLRG